MRYFKRLILRFEKKARNNYLDDKRMFMVPQEDDFAWATIRRFCPHPCHLEESKMKKQAENVGVDEHLSGMERLVAPSSFNLKPRKSLKITIFGKNLHAFDAALISAILVHFKELPIKVRGKRMQRNLTL